MGRSDLGAGRQGGEGLHHGQRSVTSVCRSKTRPKAERTALLRTRRRAPQEFINLVNKRTRRGPSFANVPAHPDTVFKSGRPVWRGEMLFCAGRILIVSACVGLGAVQLAAAADIPYTVKSPPPTNVP